MKAQFHYLTAAEQKTVHHLTATFLAEDGVIFADGGLRRKLISLGAAAKGERVFFPADIVEELMATSTQKNGSQGKDGVMNRGFTSLIVDEKTGVFRKTTLEDIRKLCRLGNELSAMDFISLPYTEQQEEALYIANKICQKPIFSPCSSQKTLDLMAHGNVECHCFLQRQYAVFEESLGQMMEKAAKHEIPLAVFPRNICANGLSPAEKLLLTNIHNVTVAVTMKLLLRKNFVYYCGLPMYDGCSSENIFLNCALGQMAAFYDMTALLFCDGSEMRHFSESDGFIKNVRYQSVQYAIPHALCAWLGSVNLGAAYSLPDLVLDNEVHAMTKGYTREFTVDKEHLGTKAIKEVGPGGHFLFHPHTLKHFSHELWLKEATASFLFSGSNFRKEAQSMVDAYLKP